MRAREASLGAFLQLVAMSGACGGEHPQDDGGESSADHETTTSETTTSGSTTAAAEPCSQVHEGDLLVRQGTNLASLENVGHVRGNLRVILADREQADLSFLRCLHTIDGSLDIRGNTRLESTEGLENLRTVQGITIVDNANLRTAVGFESLRETVGITFYGNPSAESLQFESLETLSWMRIGFCADTMPAANNLALTDLAGFTALKQIERLTVEGNEALMTAEILDSLLVNGVSEPLQIAVIRHNPLLSEESIILALDALGVKQRNLCGNAGGISECVCMIGE